MRVFVSADEWSPVQPLQAYLVAQGHGVQALAETGGHEGISSCDAGFMYIHKPIESHVEKALIGYAEGGGRLIVLHHGIASGKLANPDWMRFTGMHLEPRDAPVNAWKVEANAVHALVNLNPSHYINSHQVAYSDTCDYTSSDAPSASGTYPAVIFPDTEFFRNQHFADGREKTVLFGSRCEVPGTGEVIMQDRGGWLKRAGSGWLFYFQPGHRDVDFENRAYLQILHNCLTWDGNQA